MRLGPPPHHPSRCPGPTQARHALHNLADALPSTVLDDLRLIVTGLVANSVRRSGLTEGKPIVLRVQASPDRVRVEVADAPGGFSPVPRRPGLLTESGGWGLYLVDHLADRWGRVPGDGVWAEVDWAA